MYEPCLCGDPACPACGPWYAEQAAADEEADLTYQRMLDDDAYRAQLAAYDAVAEAHGGDAPIITAHDLF